MNQAISLAFLVALLLPLAWKLARDFPKGLAYAVFLCVSMSTFLRIPLPGSLPQLTVFRLILVVMFLFWLRLPSLKERISALPHSRCFWFWGLANLVSLLLTTADFVPSLKRYLDFVLEMWGFYLILGTSIETRDQAFALLRSAVAGLGLVALLAFVEKYTGFNPVRYLAISDDEAASFRDVVATYQHRILLGTAMAMTMPLAFVLANRAAVPRQKVLLWGITLGSAAACYFAHSRGPWLGTALAGTVLILLGGSKIRRGMICIFALTLAVLLARPGVYETLFDSAKTTTDRESLKGKTFMYRLELWKVAWSKITESPVRFLFGHGPGCGIDSEVEWELSYGGKGSTIESWDNHYAYDLYQSGILGLLARLILYFSVVRMAYRAYREAAPPDRDILAALLASSVVLLFMMTNVLIFSKQLNFLFWTIAAVTNVLRVQVHEAADSQVIEEEVLVAQPPHPEQTQPA
jgi:hypothetical protein